MPRVTLSQAQNHRVVSQANNPLRNGSRCSAKEKLYNAKERLNNEDLYVIIIGNE